MSKRNSSPVLLMVGQQAFLADRSEDGIRISEQGSGAAAAAMNRVLEDANGRTVTVIWEPFAMTHTRVECPPRITRKIFSSIAEISREHPAVSSDVLGWGIEESKTDGVAVRTWLHAETLPELHSAVVPLTDNGWRIRGVWSLATMALRTLAEEKAGALVVFAPPFVAVYSEGKGRRGGVAQAATCTGFDVSDPAARSQVVEMLSPLLDARERPLWRLVASDKGLEEVANLLGAESGDASQGPVAWKEALVGVARIPWSALGDAARRTPRSHPGNLWESFPQPFPMGMCLRYAAVGLLMMSVAMGFAWAWATFTSRDEAESATQLLEGLKQEVTHLEDNQSKIAKLRANGPSVAEGVELQKGRGDALRAMAAVVPESFTITQFTLEPNNAIQADFLRVGPTSTGKGDVETLVREWQKLGFMRHEEKADSARMGDEDVEVVKVTGSWVHRPNAPTAQVTSAKN